MFRVEIKRAGQTLETLASADYFTRENAFRGIEFLAESAGVEIWEYARGMLAAFNLYGIESSVGYAVIYLTSDCEYAAHVTGVE
mgnify:CR=1 FL=1